MIPKTVALKNDAGKLFYINCDKFKFSSLTLLLRVDDNISNTVDEGMLMSVLARGTSEYKTVGELNRRLDMLYSMDLGTRRLVLSNNHFIGVTVEFLEKKYIHDGKSPVADAIEIVEQILFRPLLDEKGLLCENYVSGEKLNMINSLKSQKNNTRAYASVLCRELLFDGNKDELTLEQTIEAVKKITPRSLTEFYKKLIGGCSVVCFYVGNTPDEINNCLSSMLNKYKLVSDIPEAFTLKEIKLPNTVKRKSIKMNVSQCKLAIGYKTDIKIVNSYDSVNKKYLPEKDVYAMQVLNEIFGGCTSSKLFMNVREKYGLCYYCSSSYSIYSGILMVSSGIDNENRIETEIKIDEQLDEITKGNITAAELNAAKLSLRFGYTQITDSTSALENFYLWRWLIMPGVTNTEVIEGIMNVSVDDIVRVSRSLKKGSVAYISGEEEPVSESEI